MSNKVRVGVIGVGNCASSFVQGLEYYKHATQGESIPGLMHVDLGGYHISDIEISAAFDIDGEKVDQNRVVMTMVPVGDQWKVSKVTAL